MKTRSDYIPAIGWFVGFLILFVVSVSSANDTAKIVFAIFAGIAINQSVDWFRMPNKYIVSAGEKLKINKKE